jgi:hypothetical protein
VARGHCACLRSSAQRAPEQPVQPILPIQLSVPVMVSGSPAGPCHSGADTQPSGRRCPTCGRSGNTRYAPAKTGREITFSDSKPISTPAGRPWRVITISWWAGRARFFRAWRAARSTVLTMIDELISERLSFQRRLPCFARDQQREAGHAQRTRRRRVRWQWSCDKTGIGSR